MFPPDEGSYQVVTGIEFGACGVEALDADQIRDGLKVLDHGMRPASPSDLTKAVAYLSVRCKRRETSEQDTDLAVRVMVQDLSELPGDVALWALDQWSRKSPWWPTRAEILGLAKRQCGQRSWAKSRLEMASRKLETATAA